MGLAIRKLANWEEEKAEWEERKAKPKKSKFSLKKLLQKPKKKKGEVKDLSDLPNLREKDSHPDAPARQPIFAEKDLGAPLESRIKPFDQQDAVAETEDSAQESSKPDVVPAPFIMDKSLQPPEPQNHEQEAPLDLSGQVSVPAGLEAAQPAAAASESDKAPLVEPEPAAFVAPPVNMVVETVSEPKEDLSALSIGQLTARLEAGLDRLQQLHQSAPQPLVAAPSPAKVSAPGGINVSSEPAPSVPPVLKSVEPTQEEIDAKRHADMDAALKAALGTLEK